MLSNSGFPVPKGPATASTTSALVRDYCTIQQFNLTPSRRHTSATTTSGVVSRQRRAEKHALETEYKNGCENGHKHLPGSSTHTTISAYTVVAGSPNKHHSRTRPAPTRGSLQAKKKGAAKTRRSLLGVLITTIHQLSVESLPVPSPCCLKQTTSFRHTQLSSLRSSCSSSSLACRTSWIVGSSRPIGPPARPALPLAPTHCR